MHAVASKAVILKNAPARAFQCAAAGLLAVLVLPLFVLVALAMMLTDDYPDFDEG